MRKKQLKSMLISACSAILIITALCPAVTSKITRQTSAADFLKGETDDTIIDSRGTIQLARQSTEIELDDLLEDVWIINDIVTDDSGNTFLATSPNGDIIKYAHGKAQKIYPLQTEPAPKAPETEDPNDPNSVQEEIEPFLNKHIFAIALDNKNRLLAAVSGDECKLIRFEDGTPETIFEPNDVNYILAIELDAAGNIYLGTGPEGIVYRLSPSGKQPSVVYDSQDNNILSLAIDSSNFIYAGADQRGLVYKIHPFNQTASVLFDAKQNEITDLLFDEAGDLYVTATSAQSISSQTRSSGIAASASPGRPDTESAPDNDSQTELNVAQTARPDSAPPVSPPEQAQRGSRTKSAGSIYKIDKKGFVTDIFSDMAVFFTMAPQDGNILLGTGNNARLFTINPKTETKAIAYEDKQASQITALEVTGDDVLIGTANPPKLITLSKDFAAEGSFSSSLVDASQPARWGKLQLEADLPDDCKILLSTRSGNVNEPNDPTFSDWSTPIEVTQATQIDCPIARFCQYKLTLTTSDPSITPTVYQVAVPHVIDNMAPIVTAVKALPSKDPKKPGVFLLSALATDKNKDTLTYEIDFRKLRQTRWIQLKDKLPTTKFEWDTKTVEDGRYEIRVTANDIKSNTPATAMTGSRISDQLVIDNTAPVVESEDIEVTKNTATLKLVLKDKFSVIGNLSYTVNSNEDWTSTLPDDLIYDSTTEEFTVVIEDLEPGENIIALKISDDLKNTKYRSFQVNPE